MAATAKQKIIFYIILIFLSGCANQVPPGGGEPDRIPPEVVEIYPPDGTINFDDDYMEIEFSEYIDKRSFQDALFISPYIEGGMDFSWTGTTVTVEFNEHLKKDFTYTINIGSDVVDLNNKNRMSDSYTFTFATGNKIDKRMISGKVYAEKPEGILIYAYRLGTANDTLLNGKPDYVSQTGSIGNYELKGLGESIYRIFAVKDEYKDLKYDLDQDMIGVPFQDVSLTGEDTLFIDLNFKLFKADTTAPRLLKGIMTDEKHILVTLTEDIKQDLLTPSNFSLIDSTTDKTLPVQFVFRKYGKPGELVLVPEEKLSIDNSVFLTAGILRDTLNNEYQNDFIHLTVSDRVDTAAINVIASEPPKGSTIDFINPKIKFYLDDGFLKNDIQKKLTFTDTLGNEVPFNIEYEDDATLNISPVKDLKSDKNYIIKLDLNKFVDAAGNKRDSVYKFDFKTISGLDFTGVSGKVGNLENQLNPVLVLESFDVKGLKYQKRLPDENFEFKRIEAGKYFLWCYSDADSNFQYDYGWMQPIKYSEKFSVYSDTLKLKPRWTITDVQFDLK